MRTRTIRRVVAAIAVLIAIAIAIFLGGLAYAGADQKTQEVDWTAPGIHFMAR